jgi:hypothetical protein
MDKENISRANDEYFLMSSPACDGVKLFAVYICEFSELVKYGTAFDPCSFIVCCKLICCNGINTHARGSLLPLRFYWRSSMSRSFVVG